MSIILDLIVVAIIAISVIIAAKKGFVKTLIEVLGFILALVIAITASAPIATFAYDKVARPVIEETVVSVLDGVSDSSSESVNNITDSIWEGLPDFVVGVAASNGITKDSVSSQLTEITAINSEEVSRQLTASVFEPLVTNLLRTIITIILFILLLVVVKLLAKFINKLFSGAVFGGANRFLGGVLGLIKGTVYALLICLLFSALVNLNENGFLSITAETLDSTYIFSKLIEILPFEI